MKIAASFCVGLILALLWIVGPGSPTTKAQAPDPLEDIGINLFNARLPVENGYINASSGDLHLEFLLGSFPQRHNHKTVTIKMVYDSAMWTQLQCCAWFPIYQLFTYGTNGRHFIPGWRYEVSETSGQTINNSNPVATCRTDGVDEWDRESGFRWTEPNGTVHSFNLTTYQGWQTACGDFRSHTTSGNSYAADGSGFHIYVSGSSILSVFGPDGTQVWAPDTISPPFQNPKDTNGNYFSHDSNKNLIDSLGRTPVTLAVGTTTATLSVLNSKGTTSTYTLTFVPISISTNFSAAGSTYTEYSATTFEGIQSIALPDGTTYSFGYDSGTTAGHYGQLISMTLPTGGHVTYTYGTYRDSLYLAPSPHNHYTRGVTSRATPDGSWTYTPQVVSFCTDTGNSNCQQQYTVTAPNGDASTFLSIINNVGAWPIKAAYYSGAISASNLLVTQTQTFNFAAGNNKQDDTTSVPLPGGATLNRTTQYCWNSTITNVWEMTKKWEWNFYSGAPLALPTNCVPAATPDRTTTVTYLSDSNSGYVTKDILDRVLTVTVADKTGNVVGKTINCYDYAGGCGGAGYSLISNTAQHDDTNFGTANTLRGDLTQVQKLISGTSTYAVTSMSYDTTGQVTTATDANGTPSAYSYADNFLNDNGDSTTPIAFTPPKSTNAYLKTMTKGGLTNTFGYYWGTGQKALETDPNNQTTYHHFYDSLNRPTSTRYPDNGWNFSVYPVGSETQVDSASGITSTSMTTNCPSTSNACSHDEILKDSLGRVTTRILMSDPDGQTTTSTVYDSNGRVQKVSNPFRSTSDSTYGWITHTYDGLNRITQSLQQDGSISKTYFGASVTAGGGASSQLCSSTTYGSGYPVLNVDEAGNKAQSWTDGFGRLIEADEPDSTNSLTVPTCYTYDANNNPIGVVQNGSRQRTFGYDLLSRLLSAANPESGSITYTYDNNGNLLTRTDARNVKTTYTYDSLNRNTRKSYSDGTPTANFYYDAAPSFWAGGEQNTLGRLVEATTNNTATEFSYDPVGRIVQRVVCTPVNCTVGPNGQTGSGWSYYYTRNLAGGVTQFNDGVFTWPQYFNQIYDGAGRVTNVTSTVSDAQHPATFFTADATNGFFPNGALRKAALGNGLTITNVYDKRLQPCLIEVNNNGTLLQNCSDGTPAGNVLDFWMGYNAGTTDNGNLMNWNATGAQSFVRTYGYDKLNRVITMTETVAAQPCKGLSWNYDAWGNRTDQNLTAGSCGQFHATADALNRLHDTSNFYQYDAAGNMIHDASHSYSYDAENRLTAVDAGAAASYIYDALGRRTKKTVGSSYEYIYDNEGNIGWELLNGSINRAYIRSNGRLLAEYYQGTTYFIHQDHLGSTRLLTGYPSSSSTPECDDYYPYGETNVNVNTCLVASFTTLKYTGKERDSEAGLDNFGARYDSSAMGRFMSPDGPLLDQEASAPQSWNLYSYVRNNPISNSDPNGETCIRGAGGAFHDDQGPGPTCAEIQAADKIVTPSAVVTAKAPVSADDQRIFDFANDINRLDIQNNTLKIFGAGAVIGLTGGAACYYLCPAATVTTLGTMGMAGAGAAPILYRTGQIVEEVIQTSAGPVKIVGEVVVEGTQITIKNISIFSAETGEKINVGVGALLRGIKPLLAQLRDAGYTTVRFVAERYSGKNPGPRDITMQLR